VSADPRLQEFQDMRPTARQASLRILFASVMMLGLGACTGLQRSDPLEVAVAGIEPMQGEGLELRMLVRLRVQNPNDTPLDYDGVYLKLEVMDKTFATGVSGERGTVGRFGESVIDVPVTVSMLRMVRQALGMLDGQPVDKVTYRLTGKLSGPGFRASRFHAEGEFSLPTGETPAAPASDLTTP
jgi:LEA14-like dessication related protein